MSGIQKVSERVIDYAERLSDMADAAEGNHRQTTHLVRRWVLLPAAGAGLFALAKSDFLNRRVKEVVDEAKTIAADLPEELMTRVHDATQLGSNGNRAARGGSAQSRRTTGSARRSRKTNTRRRTNAGAAR
jgi:hypothetical protein